jgi:hypothetical protein
MIWEKNKEGIVYRLFWDSRQYIVAFKYKDYKYPEFNFNLYCFSRREVGSVVSMGLRWLKKHL